MNTDIFQVIKAIVLSRANEKQACTDQYLRARKSGSLTELLQVVKDNFHWVCRNGIITPDLIEKYRQEFADNDIFFNENTEYGFLLCCNATAEAYGNTVVGVCGNSTVKSGDRTSLMVWDNATVEAYDNAEVKVYDHAMAKVWATVTIEAYDNTSVEAHDYATVRVWGNASVSAYDNVTVEGYDNATLKACDNAYCNSYNRLKFSLQNNAIYRVRSENAIYFANEGIAFRMYEN